MDAADLQRLAQAKSLLVDDTLSRRFSQFFGDPLDMPFRLLPESFEESLTKKLETVLVKWISTVSGVVHGGHSVRSAPVTHRIVGAALGAAGGTFGLPGFLVEVPATVSLLLKSMLEVAAAEGMDPRSGETQLLCLLLLAHDDEINLSDQLTFFQSLDTQVQNLQVSVSNGNTSAEGVSREVVQNILRLVAVKFRVNMARKALVQSIPGVGAMTGAAINAAFIAYYQNLTRAYFMMRTLKNRYDWNVVCRLAEES